MDRFFFKCLYCERPLAVDAASEDVKLIQQAPCPLCDSKELRLMGRVEGKNLVKKSVGVPCDARCTNAQGPKCNCVCSNHNHGTQKLVVFTKSVGKLDIVNKDMLNNNEAYLARIHKLASTKRSLQDMIKKYLDLRYGEVVEKIKRGGSRLTYEEYTAYYARKSFLKQMDKIEDMKQVKRKVTSLAHLFAKVRNA